MKRWCLLLVSLAVLLLPLSAAEEKADPRPPGVSLAQGITEITGVAISPLLGVSAVGSWTYYQTPPDQRADLAWYCQPWAWCSGFVILSLCFLKDALGTAVPGILKKPFDLAELFENKASALVASAAFVPLVAAEMARAQGPVEVPTATLGWPLVAALDPAWVTVPAAVIAFALVWVCSHTVNVLILLSPFSSVDTLLKLARTTALALVAIAYAIAPWLGLLVCCGILLAALWFAPSAIRLMIFGTRLAGDLVWSSHSRRRAEPSQPHAFLLRKIAGLPSRIGGRVVKSSTGQLEFRTRRGFLGPEKCVALPSGRHELAKGLLMPVLLTLDNDGQESRTLLLLPRYRGQENHVADALELHAVRDPAWSRGWTAVRSWWRELSGRPLAR
ncbi:hypothetical protein HNR46_003300 [Haloferula luteola]|uniref:Uncharacterized protein n=1 Tax=Haloferula luteola TaxID=595692 RepID=A0A840V421_9BACT|nr:hypothetical protein [Haloferula luteola]MBB5353047.1 hypothetical protein [Haloferula luteola]